MARGECFALLGPNGAGKTTVVEILEGFRPRTRRRGLRARRRSGTRPPAQWRARVGIVLQSTGEFEALTVDEVVRHFADVLPRPTRPRRGDRRGRAGGEGDRPRRTLSGGQRRRLDVALGIIGRPELLFLDEPTTGFDPEARIEFWELIHSLSAEGTTILLTTHYLEEAEALADRVGVISRRCGWSRCHPGDAGWPGHGGHDRLLGRARPAGRPRTPTPRPPRSTKLAAQFGGEVPGLTVARPTLEDIYLRNDRQRKGDEVSTLTTTAADTARPAAGTGPLHAARIGWERGKLEVREFFRQRESVLFTLAFPVMLLLIFGSMLNYDHARWHPVRPVLRTRHPRHRPVRGLLPDARDPDRDRARQGRAQAPAKARRCRRRPTSSARS